MVRNHFDEAAANWDDKPARLALMKAIGEKIVVEVQPTTEMDVLDYGCGTGLVSLYLLPHVRSVTGADNSTGMLDVLRAKISESKIRNMQAVHLDLERDPVPQARYHMIVVSMAMHHVRQTERVLQAFHELLVPGGILCVADLDTEPGTFHPADVAGSVHHHGFDRGNLKQRLASLGFASPKDVTVSTFKKPVESGEEQEFSIFLVTARRREAP